MTTHTLEPGCTDPVTVLSAAVDRALTGCAEALARAVEFWTDDAVRSPGGRAACRR